ncbi:hypothetical protein G6F63_014871 [Rhizopus arrhizus]|nr:hypothetical protein G6F63_014871 [Rhizopus arrhizus]
MPSPRRPARRPDHARPVPREEEPALAPRQGHCGRPRAAGQCRGPIGREGRRQALARGSGPSMVLPDLHPVPVRARSLGGP